MSSSAFASSSVGLASPNSSEVTYLALSKSAHESGCAGALYVSVTPSVVVRNPMFPGELATKSIAFPSPSKIKWYSLSATCSFTGICVIPSGVIT